MFAKVIVLLISIRFLVWCNVPPETTITTTEAPTTTREPYEWRPKGYRQGLLGGSPSHISKHPYLASIGHKNEIVGCASIIRKRWLLTSMNCIFLYEPSDLCIRVGSEFAESGGQTMHAEQIFRHPENDGTWTADVALILLDKDIQFGEHASPIQISKDVPQENGTLTHVSGWGYASPQAERLTVVEDSYPILDLATCLTRFVKPERRGLSFKSICTFKEGHVPCLNDEGNPLMYNGHVVGVYSGTDNCYEAKHPAGYASFNYYYDWIHDTLRNNSKNGDRRK